MSLKTSITRRFEWDMGHRIPNHESLCRNLHGHRYVAEVTIEGPIIEEERSPERGMVKDFGFMKEILRFIPDKLDHSFMVHKEDPLAAYLAQFEKNLYEPNVQALRIIEVDFVPTAENIAAYILKRVDRASSEFKVVAVTVWETPNCKATVIP